MTAPAPGMKRTREQLVAARAFAQIDQALRSLEHRPAERKQYRSIILSAPALVHNAGLVQAVAFISSRKEAAQKRLADDLAKVVLGDSAAAEQLLGRAREGELRDYMYLTHRVLEALLWFRRYAQILIPDSEQAGKEPRQ